MWERRGEENTERVMEERKCFSCRGFGHVAYYYKVKKEERLTQVPLNRFEVLKDRVIQREKRGGSEVVKDKREILREEQAKKRVEVRHTKVEKKKERKGIKRSSSKNWVEARRRGRRNSDGSVVG